MDKTQIINLPETLGVSENDYVMVDSPTQGVRKVLASKFQSSTDKIVKSAAIMFNNAIISSLSATGTNIVHS